MKRLKKPLLIALAVAGGLVLLAILLGTLNALVGGGEWTFFWSTYRYDDEGYTVGDGTVYADTLTVLDVDWIDGRVEIVICEDLYPSVSERVSGDVTESARMRYRVSEDGTLLVKYRAPSVFLGNGENENKDLTVRIPRRMLAGMRELRLKTRSSDVFVEEIPFERMTLEGKSGDVELALNAATEWVRVTSEGGNVTLLAADAPSLSIDFSSTRGGAAILDFPYERIDGDYVCGDGSTEISVATATGDLYLKRKK